jgi:16S rRNA (cytidine1402-2'-O)-methyltransferase
MHKGILYLVPTPIGNLSDMTYRSVEILKTVDIIACEDTRTSIKLLKHYEVKNTLVSYHKFNEAKQTKVLIEQLMQGKNVAIITDAGTPGISDPASFVVKSAVDNDIKVCALPGATACITALAASGLNTDSFTFVGFLPVKNKDRKQLLQTLIDLPHTLVIYESSHRIKETLTELAQVFSSRRFVLARELSKLFETYYRGNLDDLDFLVDLETRGEFVLMIEGKAKIDLSDDEIIALLKKHKQNHPKTSELSEIVAQTYSLQPNRVYKLALKLK